MGKKRADAVRPEDIAGAKGAEDGVDVDAGIVVVDASPPDQTIATSEILRTGDDTASGALPGKAFILDLGPIFRLLDIKPKDRPGHNLGRFCDNLLAAASPALAPTRRKGRRFSCFASTWMTTGPCAPPSPSSTRPAIISCATASRPKRWRPRWSMPWMPAEGTNEDGSIDVERALDAQSRRRRAVEDKRQAKASAVLAPNAKAQPLLEQKPKPPPPEPEWIAVKTTDRSAGMRFKRGPERRGKFPNPIAGPDRRIIAHGRRQCDDPKIQAW